MPNIAIVVLNILKKDPNYAEFKKKSAAEKIEAIVERIKLLLADLKRKEPDAKWLFVWREYAIDDYGTRFISSECKTSLKNAFKKLTAEHKQLIIISGAVETAKSVGEEKLLQKIPLIKEYYEASLEANKLEQTEKHFAQFLAVKDTSLGAIIARNTIYVFEDGQCTERHDKENPFEETLTKKPLDYTRKDKLTFSSHPNLIYQPGNQQNSTCIYTLNLGEDVFTYSLETCMEFAVGRLADELCWLDEDITPILQLVLADTTGVKLNNFQAKYLLLVDSKIRPQLILNKKIGEEELQQLPLRLYENNLLTKIPLLRGPLMPIYPEIETQILYRFTELLEQIGDSERPDKNTLYAAMSTIMKQFNKDASMGEKPRRIVARIINLSAYQTFSKHPATDSQLKTINLELNAILNLIAKSTFVIAPRDEEDVKTFDYQQLNLFYNKKRKIVEIAPSIAVEDLNKNDDLKEDRSKRAKMTETLLTPFEPSGPKS